MARGGALTVAAVADEGRVARFVEYFSRDVGPTGPVEPFERGLACAREWARLAALGTPPREDVARLFVTLEGEPDPGSGWLELRDHVIAWSERLRP